MIAATIYDAVIVMIVKKFGKEFCEDLFRNHVIGHSITGRLIVNLDFGTDEALNKFAALQGGEFCFIHGDRDCTGTLNLRRAQTFDLCGNE